MTAQTQVNTHIAHSTSAWPHTQNTLVTYLRYLRLPPQLNLILPSSGYYAVEGVWYRRFGTTYQSHLQGSSCQKDPRPVKMEQTGSQETSVSNHLTPHNNPEDGRIQIIYLLYYQRRSDVGLPTASNTCTCTTPHTVDATVFILS